MGRVSDKRLRRGLRPAPRRATTNPVNAPVNVKTLNDRAQSTSGPSPSTDVYDPGTPRLEEIDSNPAAQLRNEIAQAGIPTGEAQQLAREMLSVRDSVVGLLNKLRNKGLL